MDNSNKLLFFKSFGLIDKNKIKENTVSNAINLKSVRINKQFFDNLPLKLTTERKIKYYKENKLKKKQFIGSNFEFYCNKIIRNVKKSKNTKQKLNELSNFYSFL